VWPFLRTKKHRETRLNYVFHFFPFKVSASEYETIRTADLSNKKRLTRKNVISLILVSENIKGMCGLMSVKIVINTPVYRRTNITSMYYFYMKQELVPQLKMFGFDVDVLVSGDRFDYLTFEPFESENFVFVECENNLGLKKNRMLKEALARDADIVALIDSDDFVHANTLQKLVDLVRINLFWASIENFAFFDTDMRTFCEFKGYASSHSLFRNGMGSCRVFSRLLIEQLGDKPFKEDVNKSMDASIKAKLSYLAIPYRHRLLTQDAYLPIGLKSSENIWPLSAYKTIMLDASDPKVVWLSPKYLQF